MPSLEKEQKKPIVAICYDFDKTLTPVEMQSQGFIQKLGFDEETFWKKSNSLADNFKMDQNLAWMYEMKLESEGKELFTREKFREYGEQIHLCTGVDTWFDRINKFGEENGVLVEHYIISSGLKEMIEGTKIANKFKKIYASCFLYNDKGVAVWPAQVINYTNKTQFLFRIEKGCLDDNDQSINEHFSPDNLRIPFRNIVYIGDSDTDVPCMRLVNSFGGYSIGVYNADTKDKTKVYNMMRDKRIKYFEPADYSENGELENLVKKIITRTAINEQIEERYYSCSREVSEYDEEDNSRTNLILKLEASTSFKQTHQIIEEMHKIDIENWTEKDVLSIATIVLENTQVSFVVNDTDIHPFIITLFNKYKESVQSSNSDIIQKVLEMLNSS